MTSMKNLKSGKIVYSCSGCSNVAQLANDIAVCMDREGLAEMSCIAGVGGDVPSLVKKAKQAREIIAIDGCKLRCVQNTLSRHNIIPSVSIDLSTLGYRKKYGAEFPSRDVMMAFKEVVNISCEQSRTA